MKTKTALVINDLHLPFVDKPLWKLLQDFCKVLKPDVRVWNGDLFDFYQISKYDVNPRRAAGMWEERGDAVRLIEQMVKAHRCKDIALPGNHEMRLVKWMWKHDVTMNNIGANELTWYRFLDLEAMGFEVLDFDQANLPTMQLGHLKLFHGDRCNKHAVVNIANDWGCSVLYGHTHRMRSYFKTTFSTTHGVFENGHLAASTFSRQYLPGVADWQQGFAIVTYDTRTGWFHVEQIPVCRVEGQGVKRFMYGGTLYDCRT